MISQNPVHRPKNTFHVRVGHTSVTVQGLSREDAIQHARQRLCLDMPRMWDVIQSLDDRRFEVDDDS